MSEEQYQLDDPNTQTFIREAVFQVLLPQHVLFLSRRFEVDEEK